MGASKTYSNLDLVDLPAGSQASKVQPQITTKNDLSKNLMVHYQKKYSIYIKKNNQNGDDKLPQSQNTLEADQKNHQVVSDSSSRMAFSKSLPH